jgi:hypothetical protein
MTEDLRRAPDIKQVLGIDFKKAFGSISHSVLLQKLQGFGISGDLWSCIADYMTDRAQVTTINGCQSKQMHVVRIWSASLSMLGFILFS